MKILGIDPGSRSIGYGVIEISETRLNYLCSGVIKPEIKGDFSSRLPDICFKFEKLVENFPDFVIAIESLIHVKNVVSLSKLAQARGAILAGALKSDKCSGVFEYSPNKVKSSVSGFGHADKSMIHLSIERILGATINCATHDESDALAIAITHGIEAPASNNSKNSRHRGIFSRKSGSLAASINPIKLK